MDVERQFLIPLEGLTVRDPGSMTPLAPAGEWKPWTGPRGRYWRRRVNDGTVKIGTPQTTKKTEAKTK